MKKIARILISFALLATSLAGILFWVWPNYQEFSSIKTQIETFKNRLEQGQHALVELKKVETQIQKHQEDFAKIQQAVPHDVALPALYDHIQQLAASSGLLLGSIQGQELKDSEEELSRLVLQTNLAGSYEAFKQFLNAAARSPRLLNVRSLNIASSGDSGTLQITLEIVAYAKP